VFGDDDTNTQMQYYT